MTPSFDVLVNLWFNIVFIVPVSIYKLYCYVERRLKYHSLNNQVVLITGASSGIGRALAEELFLSGCKLILCSRNEKELHALKDSLLQKAKKSPVPVPVVLPLDLSDLSQLDSRGRQALDHYGRVDILVNNGGISHRSSVADTDMDVFKKVLGVNFFGAVGLTKSLLPSMIANQSGHIVNVSSLQGLIAVPDRAAYSSSKHAIQAFSDSLRAEVAHQGLHVTVVSPGYIKTNISINSVTGDGKSYGEMDPNQAGGYTAEYTAAVIREAIECRRKEITVAPLHHHLASLYLRRLAPSLFFKIMEARAAPTVEKPKRS